MAAFGGLREVVPGRNQTFRDAHFLPGAGGGVRDELSKKYQVNLRLDIAQGIDGHNWAMSVGGGVLVGRENHFRVENQLGLPRHGQLNAHRRMTASGHAARSLC